MTKLPLTLIRLNESLYLIDLFINMVVRAGMTGQVTQVKDRIINTKYK